MATNFTRAQNTIIVSDIHLSDAEPAHPENPLWKKFKRREFFIDETFGLFLNWVQQKASGSIELVLNGDIFDFDSVMELPEQPAFSTSWLERQRGLDSQEEKSRFKMSIILREHSAWVKALRDFILKGNRAVFVIGNHDVELHWPSVQQTLIDQLDLPSPFLDHVRFCEWFYISNGDTLIEHGNQYDSYNLCSNPINPLIKKGNHTYVRIPFGNLAGKFMLNGMGFMNPHAEASFIKSSIKEYLDFYYQYVMKTQPLLMWTWFWSAIVTLIYAVRDGLLPAMRDPLTIDSRVEGIANRANATPQMVWSLRELHVHPATHNPFKILRELWLDRAIMLGLIIFVSFQFFSTLNVFVNVSIWWFIIPLILLMPLLIFYSRSVQSEVLSSQAVANEKAPIAARITKVNRVIFGHTHLQKHQWIGETEYLNTGTWSPAFEDIECTRPYGAKCFAWIRAQGEGKRVAQLYEWKGTEAVVLPIEGPAQLAAPNEEKPSEALAATS